MLSGTILRSYSPQKAAAWPIDSYREITQGILHAVLNTSWKLQLTKKQLYGHLPPKKIKNILKK